ncbi:YccF domain-containing protein [Aliikangiella coralliicola]|uniref:Inner membrane protein YccF n=1 Tax=Aliikangiella coralliicola TaxID=2592383 RepID=A0A545U804_9GAMM|nr:YccF domain-containing protein [Aliikangiella coralliicola]TQV85594.1 YccF domain-containing protein [Aliikangiella coralliicola]
MSIIFNILWIILGGFFVFCGYFFGGIVLCMTVVGIPWGIQCFKLAILALFPFGSEVTSRFPESYPTSGLNIILNIIWLIFGGLWVVFNHLIWGILLCLSIIGIPFGIQHFKLMKLGFTPFGRHIVDY